eukprot:CAMPEP_0172679898 /NCGR_PEP_ID=MMETSP1074-20121228/16385_1 /TAXON_ID=2916 /ORGANISM="Ceratium fusus, Strain PA161109" /LENGTH=201 /DNA_ID=CAMNT_0013498141 /DNA_START=44 /DNA_END=649 /DNA_ORIENTATION=-
MPDVAALNVGGRVFMVSSLDPAHPGENIIDGNEATYWISTGLYPQEILLWLSCATRVSCVRLASTRVRNVRFEGCQENEPVSFRTLAERRFEDTHGGGLQVNELHCGSSCGDDGRPLEFIRVLILSGWDDFCTVHDIQVDGEKVSSPVMSRRSSSKTTTTKVQLNERGMSMLEVTIPEQAAKGQHEPDAPRRPDGTCPWKE